MKYPRTVAAALFLCIFAASCSLSTGGAYTKQDIWVPETITTPEGMAYYYFLAARTSLWNGDLSRSIGEYEKAIEYDPKVMTLYLELAELYAKTGNLNAAAAVAEKGLAVAPDNEELLTVMAEIYSGLGEVEKSKKILERIIVLDPEE